MTTTPEEFKKRIDDNLKRGIESTVGPVPLHTPKPRVVKPLDRVEADRPPGWERPVMGQEEYAEALEKEKARLASELELEQLRKGSTPFLWNLKRYLVPTGIMALLTGAIFYFTKC